jgi:hypothetical protein
MAGASVVHHHTTIINYTPRVTSNSVQSRRRAREGVEGLIALLR